MPVFDTVTKAVRRRKPTHRSSTCRPFAPDAILEAADAASLIICITEGPPMLDMVKVRAYIDGMDVRLIGPNCPGAITP